MLPKGTKEVPVGLRKSAAWMELIIAALSEGVAVLDRDLLILFANDAFANLTGQQKTFLLGKSFFEVLAILKVEHHVDANTITHPLSEISAASLRGVYAVQKENIPFYIEIEAAYIEKLTQIVLMVRDITEKKKADDEILRINKELEAFSYSVSHDLRAPLRGIDGFSQALLEDYSAVLDDIGVGYLRRIRSATLRMGELIEGMLGLSRVTRKELEAQSVDLSAIAKEIAELFQRTEPLRKVKFDIDEQLSAFADPTLIRVVMENLLENAWKYTSKRSSAHIEFGTMEGVGRRVFFVRDDGVGFNMAYVDKLFTPFQRLHSSADFSGTGIGLATVARIIHRHGGEVWATGSVDKGATFYFTLPEKG
jgi:PAS domain S-box-containing protein